MYNKTTKMHVKKVNIYYFVYLTGTSSDASLELSNTLPTDVSNCDPPVISDVSADKKLFKVFSSIVISNRE